MKLTSAQAQDRESFKINQLSDHNTDLKLKIDELQREKIENSKVYEGHINKLEILLEEKLKELDILGVRFNKLLNEK